MTEYTGFDKIYRDIVMDIIENGTDQDPALVRAKIRRWRPCSYSFYSRRQL